MRSLYNVLFTGLAVTCVLFGIYIILLVKQLNAIQSTKSKEERETKAEAKIIARKVDQQGLEHVIAEAAGKILPRSTAKAAVSVGILDTSAMAIGILKKQIENLTVISTRLMAENLKAHQALDAYNKPVYKYSDKNLQAEFKPGDPADTTDKGSFNFIYDADLTITQYWKRNRVLGLPIGTKNSYIDIYSNDPRATIKGLKRLTVKQNQPRLGLRVQGITSYNIQRGLILPGAGLQFDIGRFSVQGNYVYDAQEEYWIPSVTGRYDIVRF